MRRTLTAGTVIALMTGVAMWFVTGAGAQGGGTIEAEVKYNGAAQVEKLKVNKDTEKCGTEAVVEKVVVGANKGLANAVVSVPGAKGATKAKAMIDQHGLQVRAARGGDAAGRARDQELRRHPAQHPHLLDRESVHQQGAAEVQEDDDGEVREAGVREDHLRRPQLDARLGGGDARPGSASPTRTASPRSTNVPPGKYKIEVWHETLGKQDEGSRRQGRAGDQGQLRDEGQVARAGDRERGRPHA